MRRINPSETPTKDLHQFLLGCVAPRPIAFASTIDANGQRNLAPYSFFNAFSSNPPIVVFSSNRRVRDNTTKDTLRNVRETGEVVINMVNHAIVRQMAIASIEYPTEISEFTKAGLTPMPSEIVRPFRIAESPAHLECRVQEVITLGEHGGAGHLIICEVLLLHVAEAVIDTNNRIDPHKIDLMGRMGRSYYVRASGPAIHTIVQSVLDIGIGYDGLPLSIAQSPYLTGNEIARMAGLTTLPNIDEVRALQQTDERVGICLKAHNPHQALHAYASELLARDRVAEAVKVAMLADHV